MHHTASGSGFVVILSGDFNCGKEKSPIGMTKLAQQPEFLAEQDGLGSPLGPQFVEDAAGVGLDRIFADVELFGDLAVAEALGDQLKDLELAWGDAEIVAPFLVSREGIAGDDWGRNFRDNDFRLPSSQPEAEPDAEGGEGRRDERAVDLNGVLHHQEAVLGPLQHGDEDSTD